MHMQPITVAKYGIGPIGAEIARLLLTKPWVKVVAAVDIDPNKIGKDLGEVIGLGRTVGVTVTPDLTVKADVVCHSTGSRLVEVAGQLKDLLGRGSHVISTDVTSWQTEVMVSGSLSITKPGFTPVPMSATLFIRAICCSSSRICASSGKESSSQVETTCDPLPSRDLSCA